MADASNTPTNPSRVAVIPIYEPTLERALSYWRLVRHRPLWTCWRLPRRQYFSLTIPSRCAPRAGRRSFSQTRGSQAIDWH